MVEWLKERHEPEDTKVPRSIFISTLMEYIWVIECPRSILVSILVSILLCQMNVDSPTYLEDGADMGIVEGNGSYDDDIDVHNYFYGDVADIITPEGEVEDFTDILDADLEGLNQDRNTND